MATATDSMTADELRRPPLLSRPPVQIWLALALLALMLSIGAAFFDHYPGDVAVARAMHAVTFESTGWAENVTDTARVPARYGLLIMAVVLAWFLYNWRASVVGIVAFFSLIGFDLVTKPMFGRPRPSPEVMGFGSPSDGFSFPSTFAMVYVTTFGLIALLLAFYYRGPGRIAGLCVCGGFLVVGATARVVLAGHWPSDMAIAYLIGFLWMSLLLWLAGFIGAASAARTPEPAGEPATVETTDG